MDKGKRRSSQKNSSSEVPKFPEESSVPRGYDESSEWEWDNKSDHFGEEDDSEESDDNTKKPVLRRSITLREQMDRELACPSKEHMDINTDDVHLISVDGYCRKNKGESGGYGAILRREDGSPIIALAGASLPSISGFYHTLEGIKGGLKLAKQHEIKKVFIACNSDRIALIVRQCFSSSKLGACGTHSSGTPFSSNKQEGLSGISSSTPSDFCVPCLKMNVAEDEFTHVLQIMKEIMELGYPYYRSGFIASMKREWNKPADYLAKLERQPTSMQKIYRPPEFPDELTSHLKEHNGQVPFYLQ